PGPGGFAGPDRALVAGQAPRAATARPGPARAAGQATGNGHGLPPTPARHRTGAGTPLLLLPAAARASPSPALLARPPRLVRPRVAGPLVAQPPLRVGVQGQLEPAERLVGQDLGQDLGLPVAEVAHVLVVEAQEGRQRKHGKVTFVVGRLVAV